MKSQSFKLISLVLILTMLLVACGQPAVQQPNGEQGQQEQNEQEEQTSSDEPVVLRISEKETVSTYNPHRATSALEYRELNWVNGLLYNRIYSEEDQRSDFYPELADGDPIKIADDGSVYQIKILEGYTFEDGTPIDAYSFEYSFKMLFDPKLANRNYNTMYKYLNADKYYVGEAEWEEVGLKVIDNYTLELTYQEEYIPDNIRSIKEDFAFVGCGLVHKETFEKCFNADRTENDYGTTLDKFVASGKYKPTKLIQGQYAEYEKRENGNPRLDDFNVNTVQVHVVTDANTVLQMFEKDELDIAIANGPEYDEYPDVYYSYTPDTYGIFVNSKSTTNPILQDNNFRYALYWGLDRETIVPAVYRTNKPSAYHYSTSTTVPDPADPNGTLNYRESKYAKDLKLDGHPIENNGYNKELAIEYFEKAYVANGNKLITVEVQYIEDNDISKSWVEALQEYYQNLFGKDKLSIQLRAIPSALVYENLNRNNLNYEILAAGGIYPNLEQPWGNSNWVSSGNDTYSTQYTVISEEGAKEWDDLYYKCTIGEYKFKPEERNIAAARMEEILYEEATYLPAYTRGNRYLLAGNIELLMEDGVGDPFVEFALLQARYSSK